MLAHWNPSGIALVSLWLLIITTSTAFSSLDDGRPVAIITGGTRGIGSGIASALADDGFDLLLTYNSNVQAAQDFVKTLQDKHPSIHCELVGGDLSKEETRHAIFDCFDTKFDGNSHHLQVAVHNAGQYLGVTSTNEAGLDAQSTSFGDNSILDENGIPNLQAMKFYQRLYGDAWIDLCERGIARMNSANGGSLIGISSPSVNSMYRPDPTYSLPGSGKCIMEYSNRILALKGAAMNINCNVIIPGVTLTDSWNYSARQYGAKSAEEIIDRAVSSRVPMKRPLEVRGIGDVVSFLCSPQGRYITGVALPVDGGMHLR